MTKNAPSKNTSLSQCDQKVLQNILTISKTFFQLLISHLKEPWCWSITKTCNEFDVSEYHAKKARKLKNSKGILAELGKKKGNALSDETKLKVLEMFESDEFIECAVGKRTIYKNQCWKKLKNKKRLLLVCLKQLYIEFKKRNPQLKTGFEKFCGPFVCALIILETWITNNIWIYVYVIRQIETVCFICVKIAQI